MTFRSTTSARHTDASDHDAPGPAADHHPDPTTDHHPKPEPTTKHHPGDHSDPDSTTERRFDNHARGHLGVISLTELERVGVDAARRRRALDRGSLVTVRRGVYRPSGVALSHEATLRSACLAVGPHAVASHRSALWIWQLLDHPQIVELSVPTTRRSTLPGMVVHRSSDLTESFRCQRLGVPVTTPARSLLDGASVLTPPQLARAVEQALIDRLVSVQALRAILDELGRPGRRGAAALRRHLDRRALDDARPESQLEPLMARLCKDARIGSVLFQQTIVLDGRTYRPDFVIPDARLVIEIDGLDAHRSREAFDRDLTRQNAFIRHGWLVLRYTSTHLRKPGKVAAEILDMARSRRQDPASRAS